jgi:hypothetical protein
MLAPATVSDAGLLAQAVVLALSNDFALPFLRRDGAPAALHARAPRFWYPLIQGARLWQVWAQDLPLAAWRVPVVRWIAGYRLYGDDDLVPAFLADLCDAHRMWLKYPQTIGIPLLCTTPALEATALLVAGPWSTDRQALAQLVPLMPNPDAHEGMGNVMSPTGSLPHPGLAVTLATVVEYAAATYGPDTIPLLLESLPDHDGWETLVPAVFGVPADVFEAGWRAYLAAEYGVGAETEPARAANGY